MHDEHQAKLETWGLSSLEAQVYLALLRNGRSLGATAVATAAGIPRPSVYPALKSLVEKGMVENGEGYGSQFAAVAPEEALPQLVATEKEKLSERELLTGDLIQGLLLANRGRDVPETRLIELIRDPRVVSERFQKLQKETEREIDALVRPPMIPLKSKYRSNPAEPESLHRGVRHRAIYESSVLEHENIAPYLKSWIEAGEEAREYKGTLPLKLALFDRKIAWMPLETNGQRHPVVSVLIRHHALGGALRMLFDCLWKESEPIKLGTKRLRKRADKPTRSRK